MKQTKFITEGAALLAIYAILLLISMYVPILGTVVTFALPLPTSEFSEDNYVWIDRDCFRIYV